MSESINQNNSGYSARKIYLTRVSDIKAERITWLVDGFLPKGALTLLSGREGLGKSLLSLKWAAEVTQGNLGDKPANVMVIAAEDSAAHVIRPRLEAVGANLELVHIVTVSFDGDQTQAIVLPLDVLRLKNEIANKEVSLLIIDPLSSSLSQTIDSHKDASVRQALDPLNKLANETGCAVLALMHQNKGQTSDLNSRVMGSRAFVAAARSNIVVVEDPDNSEHRLAASAKTNWGKSNLPSIRFGIESALLPIGSIPFVKFLGTSSHTASDLQDTSQDAFEQETAGQWLIDYLYACEGEALKKDIIKAARAAGYSEDQMERARRRVKVETVREKRSQPRTVWRLSQSS